MWNSRAVEWLAAAAFDPSACKRAWRRHQRGITLLPAGRRWDVVITPESLGLNTLRGISASRARSGPVLLDTCTGRMGFFVPPGATRDWIAPGIRCAGAGAWIATPWPLPAPGRLRWLVVPDGSGSLNDLPTIEQLVHAAGTATRRTAVAGSDS